MNSPGTHRRGDPGRQAPNPTNSRKPERNILEEAEPRAGSWINSLPPRGSPLEKAQTETPADHPRSLTNHMGAAAQG